MLCVLAEHLQRCVLCLQLLQLQPVLRGLQTQHIHEQASHTVRIAMPAAAQSLHVHVLSVWVTWGVPHQHES